jgi:hypothetical protein
LQREDVRALGRSDNVTRFDVLINEKRTSETEKKGGGGLQ